MLIEVAIAVKTPGDQTKVLEMLAELAPNGHRFGVKVDQESGQLLLLGDSEEQLEDLIGRARKAAEFDFDVGPLQVAYRETLSKSVTVKYTHKKQTGSSGQFAEVTIEFEPLPAGSGFVFENAVVGDTIPKEFIPSVEKGLKAQKESGLLAGFPVVDFRAKLTDGKYHEMDSNALTFGIAARAAFRELTSRGAVKLLEPVMKVEVVTPEDFIGGVIGDLLGRRGEVQGQDTQGNAQVVTAMVPLSNMFGYRLALGAMSQGRAEYSMQFDHYGRVPLWSPDDNDPQFPPAIGMRA